MSRNNICPLPLPTHPRLHQFRSSAGGGGRERSLCTGFISAGCSRLQASVVFLDVPGLLFTATAGCLRRHNKSIEIPTSETQICCFTGKGKNFTGACSINSQGTKPRGHKQLWPRHYRVLSRQNNSSVSQMTSLLRSLDPSVAIRA